MCDGPQTTTVTVLRMGGLVQMELHLASVSVLGTGMIHSFLNCCNSPSIHKHTHTHTHTRNCTNSVRENGQRKKRRHEKNRMTYYYQAVIINTHFHQFEKVLEKFLVVHGNQIVLPDNPVVFNLSIVTEVKMNQGKRQLRHEKHE